MTSSRTQRSYPVGAEFLREGASFRIWAPDRSSVRISLPHGELALEAQPGGYFHGFDDRAAPGDPYHVLLDDLPEKLPDPGSRWQPQGVHGPSALVDPHAFAWTDQDWRGRPLEDAVLYEMHVGTFTREGTWAAAQERLPHLRDLGVTMIEMMPVNEFPGAFGWGYDGVDLFAPTRAYGAPDDLRRFVDAAHRHGVAVILDVVYNHFGPDGNYLKRFAQDYFTDRYENEWGEAVNFDGPNAGGVRDFVIANAAYWIDEFHFDGLRLDATQCLFDAGDTHIVAEITRAARAADPRRAVVVIAENEPQDTNLLRPADQGGFGLDAVWNDDLHHSAMVAATGRAEAYYEDHAGSPQEFVSAAKYGYLFQGQTYAHQGKRRGAPSFGLAPHRFVSFLQNHDQIANSGDGRRLHALTDPALARALTAYILLAPGTPMLFQGQEFAAATPFFYFADHKPDLARLVKAGREDFLAQFPSVATAPMRARLRDPGARATFEASKLDWAEAETNAHALALHRDLLALRAAPGPLNARGLRRIDGAVLSPEAFCLRYFGEAGDDRLLVLNLGKDFIARSIPEPLTAPPANGKWALAWSSENPAYGGRGAPDVETADQWRLPARSASLLAPRTDD